MKRLLILFAIIAFKLNAQDTIRFKNGVVKAVKVSEVGLSEIRYNDFSNLTGPLYVVQKAEVASIRYANGTEDKFGDVKKSTSSNQAVVVTPPADDKIEIIRKDLYYNKRRLGESRLQKLVNLCPDPEKQNKMIPLMQDMKKYKRNQYLAGFLGLGLGLFSIPVGFVASGVTESFEPFLICVGVGTTIAITGQVISGINKSKRNAKRLEIARVYNGEM